MYDNLLANIPTDLWIGGKWRKSSDGGRFDVIDPATENKVASVASATVEDAKAALDAAQAAFPGWANTTPLRRARILNRFLQIVEARADTLAASIADVIADRRQPSIDRQHGVRERSADVDPEQHGATVAAGPPRPNHGPPSGGLQKIPQAASAGVSSSVSARCWWDGQYPLWGSGIRWQGAPLRVLARHWSGLPYRS